MPGSSSALMNFGLNLLAQPGGNLAGAIGKAGSPVLRQFQAARESERLDKRKSERDRKRDVLDRAADIFEAQIDADATAKGSNSKFAFEATQETMKKLQGDEIEINQRIEELETKKGTEEGLTDIEIAELERQKINKANNEELQVLITKENRQGNDNIKCCKP